MDISSTLIMCFCTLFCLWLLAALLWERQPFRGPIWATEGIYWYWWYIRCNWIHKEDWKRFSIIVSKFLLLLRECCYYLLDLTGQDSSELWSLIIIITLSHIVRLTCGTKHKSCSCIFVLQCVKVALIFWNRCFVEFILLNRAKFEPKPALLLLYADKYANVVKKIKETE